MGNKSYLIPLFESIGHFVGDDAIHPLPEPGRHSSLASEDAMLRGWPASHLVSQATSAGIGHVDTLRRTVLQLGVIDAHAPWTLLRAALEDFATAAWLLFGETREERLSRTLRMWAYDMEQRQKWERDANYQLGGPDAKTGAERRQEIIDIAIPLGLDPTIVARSPAVVEILDTAALHTGLDPSSLRATWRIASGFAHGRMWPNLRAATPREAMKREYGYMIALVVDDKKLAELTDYCRTLLEHVVVRYQARSQTP